MRYLRQRDGVQRERDDASHHNEYASELSCAISWILALLFPVLTFALLWTVERLQAECHSRPDNLAFQSESVAC